MTTAIAEVSVETANDLLRNWQGHRRLTRRVIEAFPEDKLFQFSVGGMRPFSELAWEFIRMAVPIAEGVATGKWAEFDQSKAKASTKADLLRIAMYVQEQGYETNPAGFTNQVNQELTRHNHSAVIFCDLNRFKAINDRLGHAQGDQVLVEVAQRLRSSVRPADLVSRLGGDEFVILLRNTTPHEVHAINQRIITAIAQPIPTPDQPTTIGVTTGTAFTDNDADADELIERADHAMYLAKTNEQAAGGEA